jgi:protein-tyrosine kinase
VDAKTNNITQDRSIGSIISDTRNLSAEQVEQIVRHQRERGVRFGEAAIALGFASTDDVAFALAQQFHYPYAAHEEQKSNTELVALNQPFSTKAEAFRAVRSQLMMRVFVDGEQGRQALAVVSPESGDGRSYFAANIAVSLAQLGGRTLLIDADMRNPRQHALFGLNSDKGLSGILAGRTESQVVQQVPGIGSLYVLPVGIQPPNPIELVERPAFGLLLRELTGKFDHVVVDTPAASRGADSQVIAARCGHALIVARKNESRVDALKDMVDAMSGGITRYCGVVMNTY